MTGFSWLNTNQIAENKFLEEIIYKSQVWKWRSIGGHNFTKRNPFEKIYDKEPMPFFSYKTFYFERVYEEARISKHEMNIW